MWASCNQDVPGYSAVLDGSTVTIQGEPDATRTVRRLDMEAAACTLGRAGAPDEVWGQVVSSTVADPIRREQWEGWEVTWSVQHGAALNMTVRSR